METPRSRRDEYSEATRRALLDSASRLFAENGFTATSLDEVAADARVTKGAVYHHFANKQALFEAVADEAEEEVAAALMAAGAEASDAWAGAVAGMDCFLDRLMDPVYRRLCFEEGPAVMGFANWWEHGEKHTIGVIRGMFAALDSEGLVDHDDLDALTELVFGTAVATALALTRADDPKAEGLRFREAMLRLVAGLRPAGRGLPEPAKPARRRAARR
ncbi:MAG TPA: TetR/AcrR family transcriptional regulator [Acidimicrobiales bacterium]|nr:TetR/AcrR family transcriptional regulator [Acidimicrobiales bacterium]